MSFVLYAVPCTWNTCVTLPGRADRGGRCFFVACSQEQLPMVWSQQIHDVPVKYLREGTPSLIENLQLQVFDPLLQFFQQLRGPQWKTW